MKLRKLAWLCPHEEIKAHDVIFNSLGESYPCPGGVFLPDDTLIIEPGHEKEVALAILKDAGVLRRRVSGDRQIWETQWTWSDESMTQKAAT